MRMRWRKNIVEWTDQDGERANLSVAFTWDALKSYSRSVWLRQAGYSVRVGGPGVFTMGKMFTGDAEVGGEVPDAVRLHNGAATLVPFAYSIRQTLAQECQTPKANGTGRAMLRIDGEGLLSLEPVLPTPGPSCSSQ